MNAVLLDTLSQILGNQLTPGGVKAWKALLAVLTKLVSEEVAKLYKLFAFFTKGKKTRVLALTSLLNPGEHL
jgi:hemoglobin-like flavoprotein